MTSGYLVKISYLVFCFIYVASTAIRLARFNSRNQTADKKYFIGLASPASAAILICYVWFLNDINADVVFLFDTNHIMLIINSLCFNGK